MVMCAVFGCGKRSVRDKGISFHRFPPIIHNRGKEIEELSKRRRNLWLSRINRADLHEQKLKDSRVCCLHFIKGKPAKLNDDINPDWAPSVSLGHKKLKINSNSATKRHERSLKRTVSKESEANAPRGSIQPVPNASNDDVMYSSSQFCAATQTEISVDFISNLENELNLLRNRLYEAEAKVSSLSMTQDSFKNNDELVKFYTGLPSYCVLMTVFNFILQAVSTSERNALSAFQEFNLFLMRLRLNLKIQDLAYRFFISQSTASRIFYKWLDASFLCMQKTIVWPEREILIKTMPLSFKSTFGTSVAVILDCFEIPIDKPSSLITRAATWSNYKHHNTVKFLIGITPQGVISFISLAWGGRASDKIIAEQCGILNHLLPGDKVMADRGFNIDESIGFYCAELVVPAFTRGKSQLSPIDIHQTRNIASLRIHVERVIGNVRQKYNILRDQIPVDLLTKKVGEELTPLDKIACVCCAFTNLSPAIVSLE